MNTRLVIRGFADGCKVFEEFHDISDEDLDSTIDAIAERHATRMVAHGPHMIELEFLDSPDPNERFCRFGTDPSGMVSPIAIALKEGGTAGGS